MAKKSYTKLLMEAVAEWDTTKTIDINGPMMDPILSYRGDGELETNKDASDILERYYFNSDRSDTLIESDEPEIPQGSVSMTDPEPSEDIKDYIENDLQEDDELADEFGDDDVIEEDDDLTSDDADDLKDLEEDDDLADLTSDDDLKDLEEDDDLADLTSDDEETPLEEDDDLETFAPEGSLALEEDEDELTDDDDVLALEEDDDAECCADGETLEEDDEVASDDNKDDDDEDVIMERLIKEMEGEDDEDEQVEEEDLNIDDELNEDFPMGPISDDEDDEEKELQEMVRIFREDIKSEKKKPVAKPVMKAKKSMVRI